MRILNISLLSILASVIWTSCGYTDTRDKSNPVEDPAHYQRVPTGECIKRIVYKRHSDIEKYDSLRIDYFHELEEYTNEDAIVIRKELDSIKRLIYLHGKTDVIETRIDSLRAELSPYKKSVVGYAFVHTFYDGKDTVSAIFVMDTLCGFGEMTVVKDFLQMKDDPIDNTSYANKIKNAKPQ